MDIKVFLFITFAISAYIVLGGFLFQHLEEKTDDAPDRSIVIVQPVGKDLPFESRESLGAFLHEILRQVMTDEWSLNLTVLERPKNRSSVFISGDDFLQQEGSGSAASLSSELVLRAEIIVRKPDKWDIYGAIFYAETLVTTIGYGHIVPTTETGRLVSCVYAIVGIPLVGLWAAAFGEKVVESATKLRKKVHKSKEDQFHRQLLIIQAILIVTIGSAIFIFCPAFMFSAIEGWPYTDGIYFCVITLLTVGFGDLVAGGSSETPVWYRVFLNLWLFFGLGWLSIIISLGIKIFRTKATAVVEQVDHKVAQIKTGIRHKLIASHMVRCQSFAGRRQISVLHSKRSSSVHVVDLATGESRIILENSLDEQQPDVHDFFREASGLTRNESGVILISEDDHHPLLTVTPAPPTSPPQQSSKRNSIVPVLSTIEESEAQDKVMAELLMAQRRRKSYVSLSHASGSDVVLQLSRKRPSLSAQSACVLLFDSRNLRRTRSEHPYNDILSSRLRLSSNNTRSPVTSTVTSPVSVKGLLRPTLSGGDSNNSNNKNKRTRSGLNFTGSNNTMMTMATSNEAADNLIVMTHHGIAESLGREIMVLRPRSKSH